MDLGLRIACIQHVSYEGPGAIEEWAQQRRHRMYVFRQDRGHRLPVTGQFDWLILMGGPMGLRDRSRFPWMADELALIREAVGAGKTVVGICLGAQLLASVLGGSVDRSPEREIGWFPVQLTDAARNQPGLSGLPDTIVPFHWHSDAFTLPEGAVQLASSAGCPNQAFVYGSSVLGLQFHLEVTPSVIEALLEHSGRDIEPGGSFVQDAETIRKGIDQHLPEAHRLLNITLDSLPGAGTLLTTERLRLRRMRPTDAHRIVRLDSDPEVKRWIDQGRPPDARHIEEDVLPHWLRMYGDTGGLGFFAAEDRATGEFLGWFHLKPWREDASRRTLELGYRLHRHRWGLGLATEGGRALLQAAFTEFGASRVVARAMAANAASLRVLEKCGMVFSDEYEETEFPGSDRQALIYEMLAEDLETSLAGF
ncbi:MAG: GNAT family N-acetyltransferase [Gammaproteobacteria bacterium]